MSEADKVRKHIEAHDRLIGLFGLEVEKVEPGRAEVSVTVDNRHLNAAGLCHGGALFSLADVAFALACNSHGTMALALEVAVNYLRPAKPGERLTAVAEEVSLGRKTGFYVIRVRNTLGQEIAFFKATAFRLEQKLVEEQGG